MSKSPQKWAEQFRPRIRSKFHSLVLGPEKSRCVSARTPRPLLPFIRTSLKKTRLPDLHFPPPYIKSQSTTSEWLFNTQTNTWTDNDSSLLFAALGKAEPLMSTATCQKFDLDLDRLPWARPLTLTLKQGNSEVKTRILAFDPDLWPTTLTYNPNLAKVKVDPRTRIQGHNYVKRFSRERSDGRTLPSTLSPSLCGR